MKKWFFSLVALAILSCGYNGSDKNNVVNDVATKEITEKVVNEIISWGAVDAYVDSENYFVYVVNSWDITASGNAVAEAMYPMVEEIPNLKGLRVVDASTKEELGRYDK